MKPMSIDPKEERKMAIPIADASSSGFDRGSSEWEVVHSANLKEIEKKKSSLKKERKLEEKENLF